MGHPKDYGSAQKKSNCDAKADLGTNDVFSFFLEPGALRSGAGQKEDRVIHLGKWRPGG
jgi:hypothetical protein